MQVCLTLDMSQDSLYSVLLSTFSTLDNDIFVFGDGSSISIRAESNVQQENMITDGRAIETLEETR